MKWSNFALTGVAILTLSISTVSMLPVVNSTPSSVISVKHGDQRGSGFAMKVPDFLTPGQVALLGLAYDVAKKDGHAQPQILQGILLQETKAGSMRSYKVAGQEFGLKANERYYGIYQIKLAAAKDVLDRYPGLKKDFKFQTTADEEIIAKLIENDLFCTVVASKYLKILESYGYNTIQQLSLAYNQGPGGARNFDPATHHYSTGVMKNIQKLKAKSV